MKVFLSWSHEVHLTYNPVASIFLQVACFRDHEYENIASLCTDGTCPPVMDLLLDTLANSMAWLLQLHRSELI